MLCSLGGGISTWASPGAAARLGCNTVASPSNNHNEPAAKAVDASGILTVATLCCCFRQSRMAQRVALLAHDMRAELQHLCVRRFGGSVGGRWGMWESVVTTYSRRVWCAFSSRRPDKYAVPPAWCRQVASSKIVNTAGYRLQAVKP